MRKPVLLLAAFVISTLIGGLLLLLIGAGVSFIQLALYRHTHPGLGARAGGLSEISATLAPLLCGVIGALIVAHRLDSSRT